MKSSDGNFMDLTAFISVYRGPLIGLIASWGAPWSDAAEIAQDSFAEAWLKRDFCRGDWTDPEVFGRWLRGVAHNKYRNWSRGRRRLQLRITTLDAGDPQHHGTSSDQNLTERLEALRRAIDRLPAKQKQAVMMHYLEETSVKEVAMLLSVSTKTVEGRLYQARRTLHRMLGAPVTSQIARRLLCLYI
jgi:RNA polymerase sigma-70 factor (ECF subfamily)